MEGYGDPAQPSPTIAQCLNGGIVWLEVECNRCKTRASLPLDAFRRPRDTADLETRSGAEMPVMPEGPLRAAGAHDQADRNARDHALPVGASGRGTMSFTSAAVVEDHGFDYARGLAGTPHERLVVLAEAIEWILDRQHEAAARQTSCACFYLRSVTPFGVVHARRCFRMAWCRK
jgi:hypothetical protein